MTPEEEEAYIASFLLGHRNTHPFYKHFLSRYDARRAKKIIDSLPFAGNRLREFVKKAGVRLIDYKVVQFTDLIRSKKPRVIYEFGAGGSTGLFAELLHENFGKYGIKGELHTFEQSKDYYQRLKSELPNELRPHVFFHYCEVKYKRVDGFRLLSYKKPHLHHPTIDLVYVDGPDHIYDGMHYKHYPFFNGDIIDLVQNGIEVRYAVNDGRWFNLPLYKKFLPSFKCTQLSRYKSFTLIPR